MFFLELFHQHEGRVRYRFSHFLFVKLNSIWRKNITENFFAQTKMLSSILTLRDTDYFLYCIPPYGVQFTAKKNNYYTLIYFFHVTL